jgi:hypothetical protein
MVLAVSDPQTNMTIIVFLGGLLGNTIWTLYKWWQTKGQYAAEGIKISFDTKFIGTAIASFVPVVAITAAGFNSLLNQVNASNPVSYGMAFLTALFGTLVINGLVNTQIKPVNIQAANELREKQILKDVALYEFNKSLKENENELTTKTKE